MDPPPADWWAGPEPAGQAPELDPGDGMVLVLDAGEPFPPDGFDDFPDD